MAKLSELTDKELINLCLARYGKDERPFAEIFHRHYDFMMRVLFRYFSRERDVEDVAQEVFLKAYQNLKQYRGNASLKTWLFSIASNTAKNELRKRSRRPQVADDSFQDVKNYFPDKKEKEPQQVIQRERSFQQAFSQLRKKEQEILLLKDAQEFTYKEIAQKLDLSLSATKMRVQRARLAMKNHYQGNDNER